jgi:beta-xylosidase
MVEAVMIWNEPNNKSHWDFEIDPHWNLFGDLVKLSSQAITSENSGVLKVLGGISPIDVNFMLNMKNQGALGQMDVVAIHGFPLDWNHWTINEWPAKLQEIQAVTSLPVWISEVGVSTFGAEEVQVFGLEKTVNLLLGRSPRIHWYSLYDLPKAWPATTRHRESEGSSYYRHFYMGLVREDGNPKQAYQTFKQFGGDLGICQWFHFEDHRITDAVNHLKLLGVRHLRTGISWADSFRPNALAWFDRQMKALEDFRVTLTFCFTPEHRGIRPHYTSPPQQPEEFADFCAAMTRRYVGHTRAGFTAPLPARSPALNGATDGQNGFAELAPSGLVAR